eukprot:jgi/Chlat1/5453/Chrsp36S00418
MGENGEHSGAATSSAEAAFKQTVDLELQLRSLLTKKSPFDPAVRSLRNAICDKYEALLFLDYDFAQSRDVEQLLWKSVFYRRIEDFRARIRKCAAAVADPATSAAATDQQQKVTTAFRGFLAEAIGFYHTLIRKLQAKFELDQNAPGYSKAAEEPRQGVLSVHRSLVCLGDLARYQELLASGDNWTRDWSAAASYYLQALRIWPDGGNPHNQLAVLATYVDDELTAVYRYVRSVAAATPFPFSRKNLQRQYEQNAIKYAKLKTLPMSDGSSKVQSAGQAVLKHPAKLNDNDFVAVRQHFSTRYVHSHGILFTRTSLGSFEEVYTETMRDLEALLNSADEALSTNVVPSARNHTGVGAAAGGSAIPFLPEFVIAVYTGKFWLQQLVRCVHLICMLNQCCFTVSNISQLPENHQPTYAEVLQHSKLYQYAFTMLYDLVGRLLRRLLSYTEPVACPLLSVCVLALEYLKSFPELKHSHEPSVREKLAREFMWSQMAKALTLLAESLTEDVHELNTALPEDYEVLGFPPLPTRAVLGMAPSSVHSSNAFVLSNQHQRAARMLAAGLELADGASGALYVDASQRLFSTAPIPKQQQQQLPPQQLQVQPAAVGMLPEANGAPTGQPKANGDVDEDEVIVFQPVKPSSPLSNASPASAASPASIPLSTSQEEREVPQYALPHMQGLFGAIGPTPGTNAVGVIGDRWQPAGQTANGGSSLFSSGFHLSTKQGLASPPPQTPPAPGLYDGYTSPRFSPTLPSQAAPQFGDLPSLQQQANQAAGHIGAGFPSQGPLFGDVLAVQQQLNPHQQQQLIAMQQHLLARASGSLRTGSSTPVPQTGHPAAMQEFNQDSSSMFRTGGARSGLKVPPGFGPQPALRPQRTQEAQLWPSGLSSNQHNWLDAFSHVRPALDPNSAGSMYNPWASLNLTAPGREFGSALPPRGDVGSLPFAGGQAYHAQPNNSSGPPTG